MNKKFKTAIIGGGAAGLSAAISVSQKTGCGSTVIIEKQNKIGRKLLATGNGRCNIGNSDLSSQHYHGDKKIINSVLSNYSLSDAEKFYSSMGLLLRKDSEGRIYPYSSRSDTVVECLRHQLQKFSVEVLCEFVIQNIRCEKNYFIISSGEHNIYAQYIIFAAGSQASPSLGSDKSGYDLLKKAGILTTPLFPSLSPVICKEKYRQLKGVRAKGKVTLFGDEKIISSRNGEIQFTEQGLSGICIFDLSRYVNEFFACGSVSGANYNSLCISADLMPDYSESDVLGYLRKFRKMFDNADTQMILSTVFDKKLAAVLLHYTGIKCKKCSDITEPELKKLSHSVKDFRFTPSELSSFKNAQVSAGGFDSTSVDPSTLMCRKLKNLYICGEMLNVDGDCGGYNLHFAFGSGTIPAKTIK